MIACHCERLADRAVSLACNASPSLCTLVLSLCRYDLWSSTYAPVFSCLLNQLLALLSGLWSPHIHGGSLTELNLAGCSILQDDSIRALCIRCPALAKLSLSFCVALSLPVIHSDSLHRIDLSHCENLKGPSIRGARIADVSVAGCCQLNDTALESICEGCPALLKLSISGCCQLRSARISSASLQVLKTS